LPQGGRDPRSFESAAHDTGVAFWNAGLGIVEAIPNLATFSLPGALDYWPFLDDFRGDYDTPLFGATVEVLATFGTLRVLGEIGAARAGAFSPIVPGGGLAAHEAAGGHLLARHVGQTQAQLAQRLVTQPSISAASTFATRAEAEAAVSAVLESDRKIATSLDMSRSAVGLPRRSGTRRAPVLREPWRLSTWYLVWRPFVERWTKGR
jgi:hypothetical protein